MNIFKRIYEYRDLLRTNVKKEIRGKYKNSVLGVLWTFLNPLLQLAVYAVVFPLILKVTQEYYVIFVCVGLIPWTFFTTTISQSAGSIIVNANIIKKVYFPREILPVSVVTSATVNFLISTLIILGFCFIFGLGITRYVIFYPIILIIQYILQLGLAFIVSSLTVYLRDIEHFVQIILMVLFYATPIVYDASALVGKFKYVTMLNPMSHIITGYRDIFYNQTMPNFVSLGIVFVISVILTVVGYFLFKKLQKGFAEEL